MLADLWLQVRDRLNEQPEGIDPETARLHFLARGSYPMAVLVHLGFAGIFWMIELWPLVWFNMASVCLWAYACWVVTFRNISHRGLYIICQCIEIPLHGILATVYLGLAPGFFVYLLMTILMTILMPFLSYRTRIAMNAVFILLLAATGCWAIYYGALAPQSATFNITMFAGNMITFSTLMAMALGMFQWDATTAEHKLRDQRDQTETANRSLANVSAQLAKYISPQLYQAIVTGEQEVRVESRRRKLTVFFSDVAGFTSITEQMESEELTELLNEYLTEMARIAQKYGANFDKFIGDAIVLYFGDPVTLGVKQDAAQCVRMAVAMQQRMTELKEHWKERGLERPFEIRIGINTGYCTVGNFGSEDRMDYTIIGGEVNLAARLEQQAGTGGILLAHETWSLVKDIVETQEGEAVTVKGLSRPVRTYRVTGLREQADVHPMLQKEISGLSLSLDPEEMTDTERRAALEALQEAIKVVENTPATDNKSD